MPLKDPAARRAYHRARYLAHRQETIDRSATWRKRHRKYIRHWTRVNRRRPEVKAKRALEATAYRATHREENRARLATYRRGLKGWAHKEVEKALRRGALKKPAHCEQCQRIPKRLEGHHEDYSKPLEVHWICHRCHATQHRLLPSTDHFTPKRHPTTGFIHDGHQA